MLGGGWGWKDGVGEGDVVQCSTTLDVKEDARGRPVKVSTVERDSLMET